MKNRNLIPYLLLILFVIGYFSCDNNREDSELLEKKFKPQEVLTQFNLNKLDFQKGEYFEGDVKIRSTLNEIVVFIGGSVKIFYVLQTKSAPSTRLSIDLETAQILFLRSELLITDINKKITYLFGWNDENATKYLKKLKVDNNYIGYGLSSFKGYNHVDVSEVNRLKTIYSSILQTQVYEEYAGRATDICDWHETNQLVGLSGCDSGGEGSTSCSVNDQYGACSASCKEDYFSCCGDYINEGGSTQNGCKCCEDD